MRSLRGARDFDAWWQLPAADCARSARPISPPSILLDHQGIPSTDGYRTRQRGRALPIADRQPLPGRCGGAGRATAFDLRAGALVASPVVDRRDHCSEDWRPWCGWMNAVIRSAAPWGVS